MNHLSGCFYLMFGGLVFTFVVFFIEIVWKNLKCLRNVRAQELNFRRKRRETTVSSKEIVVIGHR